MRKVRLGFVAAIGIVTSFFVACGDTATPPASEADGAVPDATAQPTEASVPDTSRADGAPDASPPPDASLPPDASPPPDADVVDAADAAVPDAADAAPAPCGAGEGRLCNLGETCAIDGDCATPNVCEAKACTPAPPARTVADIPNLTYFDFEGTTLVYTTNTAEVSACTLPGCADAAPIPNVTLGSPARFPIALAGGYVHYSPATSTSSAVASRSLDGALAGPSLPSASCGSPTEVRTGSLGTNGFSGLYKCWGTTTLGVTNFTYAIQLIASAARTDRIGPGSSFRHTNGDAMVTINLGSRTRPPPQMILTDAPSRIVTPFFTGLNVWASGEAEVVAKLPTEIVTTPKTFGGVNIANPMLAVLQGTDVKVALPSSGNSFSQSILVTVGTGATTINLDERYLYIGSAAGLGRCELSEVATLRTCTLVPMSAGEPVSAPLYLTPTHAWYRSGTRVRRATK